MEITDVRISLRDEERLKAFANIIFDNAFVVRGLKIIRRKDGHFVAMPSRKRPNGRHQDMAHPINPEMREYLESKVLDAYYAELEKQTGPLEPPVPPASERGDERGPETSE
ncbi:MAG: septation protein SpoVG family protein [bacterium]